MSSSSNQNFQLLQDHQKISFTRWLQYFLICNQLISNIQLVEKGFSSFRPITIRKVIRFQKADLSRWGSSSQGFSTGRRRCLIYTQSKNPLLCNYNSSHLRYYILLYLPHRKWFLNCAADGQNPSKWIEFLNVITT